VAKRDTQQGREVAEGTGVTRILEPQEPFNNAARAPAYRGSVKITVFAEDDAQEHEDRERG
jgi:hypothetical protein